MTNKRFLSVSANSGDHHQTFNFQHIPVRAVDRAGGKEPPDVTAQNVDEIYEELPDGFFDDAKRNVRNSGIETDLECPYSRHYETKAVAAKMPDGSWVGWTYYYGGGKHGEPETMPWIEDAYDLDCKEERKVVIVRTFSLKE